MVDGSDDANELTAERPSDYGHAGLEAAKEQAAKADAPKDEEKSDAKATTKKGGKAGAADEGV